MFDPSQIKNEEEKRTLARITAKIEAALEKRALEPRNVIFSAEEQFVSTSGAHAFVPPGPNDIRGPCPGLNAAANHNYIPHSGVGTIVQFVNGTFDGKTLQNHSSLNLLINMSDSIWYGT